MVKVPGFILKKLYVKNSLKNIEGGFALDMKNILAEATIIAPVKIIVDGKPLSEKDITVVVDGKEMPTTVLCAQAPMKFALQKLVNVKVKGVVLKPGKHKLQIDTATKEYDKISFVVEDEIK